MHVKVNRGCQQPVILRDDGSDWKVAKRKTRNLTILSPTTRGRSKQDEETDRDSKEKHVPVALCNPCSWFKTSSSQAFKTAEHMNVKAMAEYSQGAIKSAPNLVVGINSSRISLGRTNLIIGKDLRKFPSTALP